MRTRLQLWIGGLLLLSGGSLGACNLIFAVDDLTYDSTTFGSGGSGGVAGSSCNTVFDCPPPTGDCVDRVCDSGNCVVVNEAAGVPCPGGACDGSGSCATALGDPCTTDEDCLDGVCVDGVCCDEACDGDCVACDRPGEEGTCTPTVGPAAECQGGGCDGAGSCFQCGVASTAANPPACPQICSNCDGGTCTISCTSDTCVDQTLACPAGFDCAVNCSTDAGCDGTTVICPDENRACDVTCAAINACSGATLQCGVGPCSLQCGLHAGACEGVEMACNIQSCEATCLGATAPTLTGCSADACVCQPC